METLTQTYQPKTAMLKVVEIINGNTVRIDTNWTWQGQTGNVVVISGYNPAKLPDIGDTICKQRLTSLVFNKQIALFTPAVVKDGKLHCNVMLGSSNIAAYFPEFKV